MQVTLQVHKPTIFTGEKGKKFINKNIKRPGYWDKTDVLVDKIKDEFGFKSEKSNDILEALVDEIKNLRRALFESEHDIENLKKNNKWLQHVNRINAADLEDKNREVEHLRYSNHILRR